RARPPSARQRPAARQPDAGTSGLASLTYPRSRERQHFLALEAEFFDLEDHFIGTDLDHAQPADGVAPVQPARAGAVLLADDGDAAPAAGIVKHRHEPKVVDRDLLRRIGQEAREWIARAALV